MREQAEALRRQAPIRTFFDRVRGRHTEERAWRVGAGGEERVARELAKLGLDWRVLHGVPVGEHDADIDHVVVGPAGVFTLNTKHHPGARAWVVAKQVRINGQPQPYLRNSRHEAARAGRLLTGAAGRPVEATPVLVFVGLNELTIRQDPGDVVIATLHRIRAALAERPALFSPQAVEMIYAAARRADTWIPA